MKMNKLFIASIVIILGISTIAFGQKAELKKFEFMKGEFKSRGNEGIVKADFDKKGKEFKWEYNSGKNKSIGVVTYDKKSDSYRLTETMNGNNTMYYRGFETTAGFHFFELTNMNGIVKADGAEIVLKPMDAGMVSMERFRLVSPNAERKAVFVTDYYKKDMSSEMIAEQIRKAIKKLDFVAGTFNEDARTGQVIGKYEDSGMKYVWAFKSPRNNSDAVVTYDFDKDEYTLTETVSFKGGSKSTTKYVGRLGTDGKLELVSLEGDAVMGLILSSPSNGKILMQRSKDAVENYKGTYTRVQ